MGKKHKFTFVHRWFSYSIKIENRISELFKFAFFVLWQMEAENWSEENKNYNIPETPKEIYGGQGLPLSFQGIKSGFP